MKNSPQSGQGLVQALIATAIMGILTVVFLTMQGNQVKEGQAISEKLAALDFEQALLRIFADGSLCTYLLLNPTPTTFESSATSIDLPMTSMPVSIATGAPPFATAGQPASSVARTLVLTDRPFSIANIVGSNVGGVGSYTADFQVNFDASRLARSIKPATVRIGLQTTGAGSTQTVTSCVGGYGLQVRSGRVTNGDTVPTIPGYPKNKCQLMVSIEDAHVGPSYSATGGDAGQWGDNHYGGSQAFYDNNWQVTCRFYFSYSAWWDVNTSTFVTSQPPQWEDAWCRYVLVCT